MQAEPLPDVAVVVPVHRQPGLLAEALDSVLRQEGIAAHAVVVDDGCPFPETRTVALALARAHPGRIAYLRRANGGLSAARNTGIEFALAAWPGCRALYLLDADNRLHPGFLARALALLDASPPETGWIYPDFDIFGRPGNWSARGPYSLLLHLRENLCEAGSLVRRSVFEQGARFDETMRQGYEDWDFWLQAAGAGFVGRHLPCSGFQYRRRMDSMLAASERDRAGILAHMQQKHAALLTPRALIALAEREAPPLLLLRAGSETAELRADPTPAGDAAALHLPQATAWRRLLDALEAPAAAALPPVVAFAEPAALAALDQAGLLRNLLWHVRILLRDDHLVALHLEAGAAGEIRVATRRDAGAEARPGAAPLLFVRSAVLGEAAREARRGWLASVGGAAPKPRLGLLRVTLPAAPPQAAGGPLPALFAAAAALRRELARRRGAILPDWRPDGRISRAHAAELLLQPWDIGVPWPGTRPGRAREIGLLLPLFSFGGVERVVTHYAEVLRRHGWTPHLFVTGATEALLPDASPFASVNFLHMPEAEWPDGRATHLGAAASGFAGRAGAQDALGLLVAMDAVLATHSLAGHGLAPRLRRLGVATYVGLHVAERGAFGQPDGNPHIALGYEHAYAGFVVVSRQMRDWCAARGVPADKVLLVPNAPGYPADPERLAAALAAREGRRAGPLRVLFLGRLDPQKGIDRLAALVRRTAGGAIAWRVLGRGVLGQEADALADAGLAPEPPAMTPEALDAAYAWADVVVLPSRFEGVPLTLLEAQRFGCVVLATDVGAVREVVTDGVDGVLVRGTLPEDALVETFVRHLEGLAADPGRVARLGRAAAARAAALDWERAMAPWLAHLEAMAAARQAGATPAGAGRGDGDRPSPMR